MRRCSRFTVVEYCLHEAEAKRERVAGDTVEVRPCFDGATGCTCFSQRVLRFSPGRSRERLDAASDEVLYVLSGVGSFTLDGSPHRVGPGSGAFVAAGAPWLVDADEEVVALSVLVHDPEPASGRHAVVQIAMGETQAATAGRQFALGVGPAVGCNTVTQFVGFIPPGRAPDHFHRYDEVVYVLEGLGSLHIDGETSELRPGACVHLPARLVHSLENGGDDEMLVLGVFRPAGSPAEAYYPDGTPAMVEEP
jgi:quercetin dioxygenase-like cupin family protein